MVKLLECSITKQSDHKLLKFVSNCIKHDNDDSFDHNITGDCNLPVNNWETATLKSDGFSEIKKSCRALCHLCHNISLVNTSDAQLEVIMF